MWGKPKKRSPVRYSAVVEEGLYNLKALRVFALYTPAMDEQQEPVSVQSPEAEPINKVVGKEEVEADPVFEEIKNSRAELLSRVQNLKKDLQDWRGKLDSQVKNYRQELGELRSSLNTEVEQLRHEFQDLRNSLKRQLEVQGGEDEVVENGKNAAAVAE